MGLAGAPSTKRDGEVERRVDVNQIRVGRAGAGPVIAKRLDTPRFRVGKAGAGSGIAKRLDALKFRIGLGGAESKIAKRSEVPPFRIGLAGGKRSLIEDEEPEDVRWALALAGLESEEAALAAVPGGFRKLIKAVKAVRRVNAKLAKFEQGFISEGGIKEREWYKHLGVAPGKWLGKSHCVFSLSQSSKTTVADQSNLEL